MCHLPTYVLNLNQPQKFSNIVETSLLGRLGWIIRRFCASLSQLLLSEGINPRRTPSCLSSTTSPELTQHTRPSLIHSTFFLRTNFIFSSTMSFYHFTTEPFITFDDFSRVFDDVLVGPHANSSRIAHHQSTSNRRAFRPRYLAVPKLSKIMKADRSSSHRLDVQEGPDNTVIASFELPGLKREDLSIELHNNQLTVSGEAKSSLNAEGDDEGKKYFVQERRFGKFSRMLELPEGTQPESVKASVADGVLTVIYPKATPELAPKRIDIQ